MVSKSSLMEIAQKLLEHAKKTENMIYCNELVLKMIQMCSQNNYANIVNFEWYLNILLDLAKLHGKSTFGDVLGRFYRGRVPVLRGNTSFSVENHKKHFKFWM